MEELHVVGGPAIGSSEPIADEVVLGRAASGIGVLAGDKELSRQHARIYREADGALYVADLGSKNGTFLNGRRLDGAAPLAVGDRLGLGASMLEVRRRAAAAAETDGRPALDPATFPTVRARGAPAAEPPPAPATRLSPLRTRLAPSPLPGQPAPGGAALLYDGARFPIGPDGLTIGRGGENAIVIPTELASRRHARIDVDPLGCRLTDLGSKNGTQLGGERLHSESRRLAEGDTITIGGRSMRFVQETPIQFVAVSGERMAIGRDQTNDVVLEDPNVSRFHAEVTTGPHGLSIRDLGSRNGTRVDGVPVRTARLRVGSEIGVGPFRLIFDGASLVSRDDRGALRLDAEKVAMSVRGKAILQDTTLSIAPGEFVAIIGESGSGKTTLLKALAGVTQPTGGTVTVNGDPVGSRRFEIGYVPQDEIVHPLLTVREALRYAAKLRLPADASGDEVEQAVRRVLDELALEAHAETRIGSLSGGQRKRAGVGTELVNRPGLLFLDEATTGLDPVLERRMMELMRDLADNGRAVITITHATKNLSLCDKIVVMGRGGLMCFVGSLPDALKFFKASDADGIYAALDATEAKVWRARWLAHSPELTGTDTPASEPAPPPPMPSDRPLGRQASILAGRYVRVFLRDRKNMAILLGQVPILALFVTLLWPSTVFHHAAHNPGSATIVLFLLVTLAIWFGCVDAAREIIKERAVFVRESAVGVRTGAYLASKFTVLTALASVQTLALGAGVLAVMHLDQAAADYAALMVVLVLTSWVGVALGLTISVLAGTENQATSFIPLVLIPQLLFAGQLVPLRELPPPARVVSDVVPTRWSFAAEGRIIDLNGRYAATPATRAAGAHYGQHFFALSLPLAVVVLGAFVAVLLSAVTMRLRQIAAS